MNEALNMKVIKIQPLKWAIISLNHIKTCFAKTGGKLRKLYQIHLTNRQKCKDDGLLNVHQVKA